MNTEQIVSGGDRSALTQSLFTGRFSLAFIVALLALAPGAPAPAQEAGAPDGSSASASAAVESAEEPLTSFFAETTVTATGSERDVFEIATPVTVISAEEIERLAPRQRRGAAARSAGGRRQRRRPEPGTAGDPRPARPARALPRGRPATEQRAAADRLRRDHRPRRHGIGRPGRSRARPGLGALRQRRDRRRAEPGHEVASFRGRPALQTVRRGSAARSIDDSVDGGFDVAGTARIASTTSSATRTAAPATTRRLPVHFGEIELAAIRSR